MAEGWLLHEADVGLVHDCDMYLLLSSFLVLIVLIDSYLGRAHETDQMVKLSKIKHY